MESKYLDILRTAADLSLYSEEIREHLRDRESRIALSYRRANILMSIEELLDKNSSVLEIGAECGAITRYLGETFREVDAIEPSYAQALSAACRTRDLGNVFVYCGNPYTTEFGKKYDLIILIGGLDRLPCHVDAGSDAIPHCTRFLERLKESLSERGMLVVAAQNKLCIKGFTGYRGAYTGSYYETVMEYPEKSPVAFTRKELDKILRDAHLDHIQFFHIFPDYQFAETIIVENEENLSLKPYNWIRTPFEDPFCSRIYGLPEILLLKSLTENSLLWDFSNSFLVLASMSPDVHTAPEYLIKKFHNMETKKNYCHHFTSLIKNGNEYFVHRSPIASGKQRYVTDSFEYNLESSHLIHGNLLSVLFIQNSVKENSRIKIHRLLKLLHDDYLLKYTVGERDNEDYPLLDGRTFDFHSDNLIVDDRNTIHCIDPNPNLKENCPIDYILFRLLFYLYSRINPYITEKNFKSFVTDQIKMIYPQYSEARFNRNVEKEKIILTTTFNMNPLFSVDDLVKQDNCYQKPSKNGMVGKMIARILEFPATK